MVDSAFPFRNPHSAFAIPQPLEQVEPGEGGEPDGQERRERPKEQGPLRPRHEELAVDVEGQQVGHRHQDGMARPLHRPAVREEAFDDGLHGLTGSFAGARPQPRSIP